MLDTYILEAIANEDHAYVYLFILFMAGLVGVIEKSGGLIGITYALKKYVKTSRSAQAASFFAGIIIFFDDYANTLVAGASMRPLTDACLVSREKLAFIVSNQASSLGRAFLLHHSIICFISVTTRSCILHFVILVDR